MGGVEGLIKAWYVWDSGIFVWIMPTAKDHEIGDTQAIIWAETGRLTSACNKRIAVHLRDSTTEVLNTFPGYADCWGICSKPRPNCWLPIILSRLDFMKSLCMPGSELGTIQRYSWNFYLKYRNSWQARESLKFRPHNILGLSTAIHLDDMNRKFVLLVWRAYWADVGSYTRASDWSFHSDPILLGSCDFTPSGEVAIVRLMAGRCEQRDQQRNYRTE